jgi:hypothetical protein
MPAFVRSVVEIRIVAPTVIKASDGSKSINKLLKVQGSGEAWYSGRTISKGVPIRVSIM